MARRAGTDVFTINIRGAGREARYFDRVARGLQDDLIAELRLLGEEATIAFREAAPEDTEELRDNIDAVPFLRALRPRVRIIVNPLQGHEGEQTDHYDYALVTRRGHRKRKIVPKRGRALKVHIEGHRNPHAVIWRSSVRGYGHAERPVIDWAAEASPEIERQADDSEARLGRRIDRRLVR